MTNQPANFCEYEVKAFVCCKRLATVRIDRNGCFCRQHARKLLASLAECGRERLAEKIPPKEDHP